MSDFIPDYDGPIHPHARPIVGDLRDEIVSKLEGETAPTVQQLAHERAAEFMRRFFESVFGDVKLSRGCQREIGRRFICALWVIDPGIVGRGEPLSLHKLAEKFRYSTANLSPVTAEMSRRLGIRNHYQAHDSKSPRHASEHPAEDFDDGEQSENEVQDDEV